MDSEVQRDGRILDLIDDAWREDKLPYEDVAIPLEPAKEMCLPSDLLMTPSGRPPGRKSTWELPEGRVSVSSPLRSLQCQHPALLRDQL
ncbi:anaphase-promoting complex subunit 13 isoform X1 [Saimiri boliviensis]|uniref:anaphase-promoting complex subunit 13 isoform X1 n=1 Tax=Saimiri boliviensis TaxID=27679 RepID=UPI003D76D348